MDITLALGGGGVRGVAHIGVIRTLEEHQFKIKAIAGTSAGGLMGAVYAAGFSTQKIENAVDDFDPLRAFSRQTDDRPSLLGLGGISDKLTALLGERTFDELEIPFAATAVSLYTGKEIILTTGKVIDAVLATIAVPGIFPSQKIGGRVLIDGGILDPVPVQVARWMRPDLPVVAVTLNKRSPDFPEEEVALPIHIPGPASVIEHLNNLRPVQALKIFSQSFEVASKHLTKLSMQLYKPEVIISPPVGHIGLLQKIDVKEMVQAGMAATEDILNEIEAEANWMKTLQRKVKQHVNPDPLPDYWGNVET
ncbi:MAG: patatin-like phospholipase family protein [Chloroflexi bacterium]|jgi:NTE family protein|nr:patatin-like phospholipase family protein [Chloroflexota bacterium]